MSVIIRPAEPRDAQSVDRLLHYIAALHHGGRPDLFRPAASKYTPEQFAAILADEKTPVFVAECGGIVAGYIFCMLKERRGHPVLNDIRTLYIDDLCVDERFRAQGIGRALMERAESAAREFDCDNIELNVWEFNESAREFYEELGYTAQRREMELKLKVKKENNNADT